MTWKKPAAALAAVLALGAAALAAHRPAPTSLVLAGLVTTDGVVVASAVAGRLVTLRVREGDVVTRGQQLAELEPAELLAEQTFYARSAEALASQVDESAAALRYQERERAARIRQAEAGVAAAEGERAAAAAQVEEALALSVRFERLAAAGAATEQELDHARRTLEAGKARLGSLDRQVEAQRATLDLARASAEQSTARGAALAGARGQQAAAEAQRARADVRLGQTRLAAPIDGVVDVRAARLGEFVTAGQPVLTLVDLDDLWVRADVEETYVDRAKLGDHLRVRLPSGEERDGTVLYRGAVAAFATQRDVSRTKRDIRTFELRLRVDNRDRRLAPGSTAQVLLPLGS